MDRTQKTLVLTDNPFAHDLALELNKLYGGIEVYQSPKGALPGVPHLSVREQAAMIIANYGLVLSIHCKQLFPVELVAGTRCVNVHPGLNPYNRGWFPQVFSIINGLPSGITIHEIDNELDHGPIIAQRVYDIHPWDTSGSAYRRIMAIERELVLETFASIRDHTYQAIAPQEQGNVNYKRDFDALKQIDLQQTGTFGEFINRLRALTHEPFRNAYFIDDTGTKVFVKISLEPEHVNATAPAGAPHATPPAKQ